MAVGCLLNRRITAAACMDTDGSKARSFGRRFRVDRAFDDYDAMLKSAGVDAVYLAVPHYLHRAMIEKAVGRGFPVLCEKPIATTIDDALAVCRLSQQTGVKIGINYQYRYDAGCYALVKAAQSGALGTPLYGRCNVPWHREKGYFTGAAVACQQAGERGGHAAYPGKPYHRHRPLVAFGEPITVRGDTARRVFSDVEVEDLGMGIVGLSNGALLSITSSMIAVPERPATIEIYGSKGTGIYTGSDFLPKVRFLGTGEA